jgi:quercetin dioxygenase-like cupin family protein
MRFRRRAAPTRLASAERFSGTVYLDSVGPEGADSSLHADSVHFTPGSRTAWHSHPAGQLIHILEGIGRVGRRDGPVEEVRAGDVVWFEPDEEHWHGATPDNFMTHVATRVADAQGRGAS